MSMRGRGEIVEISGVGHAPQGVEEGEGSRDLAIEASSHQAI